MPLEQFQLLPKGNKLLRKSPGLDMDHLIAADAKISMLAPYAIKQSRSISPRRRPIKKKILSKGKQERVQGQSHIIAEYYSVAKPPSRLRPSVGCLVNYTRGPLARACILSRTWRIHMSTKLFTDSAPPSFLVMCLGCLQQESQTQNGSPTQNL